MIFLVIAVLLMFVGLLVDCLWVSEAPRKREPEPVEQLQAWLRKQKKGESHD